MSKPRISQQASASSPGGELDLRAFLTLMLNSASKFDWQGTVWTVKSSAGLAGAVAGDFEVVEFRPPGQFRWRSWYWLLENGVRVGRIVDGCGAVYGDHNPFLSATAEAATANKVVAETLPLTEPPLEWMTMLEAVEYLAVAADWLRYKWFYRKRLTSAHCCKGQWSVLARQVRNQKTEIQNEWARHLAEVEDQKTRADGQTPKAVKPDKKAKREAERYATRAHNEAVRRRESTTKLTAGLLA